MLERLKRLYGEGRITYAGLQNAVTKGLITQEEFESIITETAV